VYVRGHLRRYAEFIGESPAELQELYAGSAPAARPDLTRIARSDPGDGGARLVLPALLGLLGFALLVLLWWVLTTPGEKPQPLAAASPPVAALPHRKRPQAPLMGSAGRGRDAAGVAVLGAQLGRGL